MWKVNSNISIGDLEEIIMKSDYSKCELEFSGSFLENNVRIEVCEIGEEDILIYEFKEDFLVVWRFKLKTYKYDY